MENVGFFNKQSDIKSVKENLIRMEALYDKDDKSNKFKFGEVFEPIRSNRFLVNFENSFEIPQWVFSKVVRPNYDMISEKWNDMIFSIYDPIYPSSSEMIFKFISKLKEVKDGETIIILHYLSPSNETIYTWSIKGNFKKIVFKDLSYSTDDLDNIDIIFSPESIVLIK